MTRNNCEYVKFNALDDNGNPLAGGKVYFYEAGTTTPKDTYADPDGTILNTNPVVLDSRGDSDIFLDDGHYKIVVTDANDVTVWTRDNYTSRLDRTSYYYIDNYASLNDAIAAIGAVDATLLIDKPTTITTDLTVPENIDLKFNKPGIISGAFALTVYGGIDAGLYQIFDSTVTVTGNPKVEAVYPEWVGILGNGVSQSASELNKLISGISAGGGGKFEFTGASGHDYLFSDAINLDSNIKFVIDTGVQLRTNNNSRYDLIRIVGTSTNRISNVEVTGGGTLKGWDAVGASGTGEGIYVEYADNVVVDGITIDTFTDAGVFYNISVKNSYIRNNTIRNTVVCVYVGNSSENIIIENNILSLGSITAAQYDVVDIETTDSTTGRMKNINIANNIINSNYRYGINVNAGADNFTVSGNIVDGFSSSDSGIVVRDGSYGTVTGNTSINTTGYGIEVRGSVTGLEISGNTTYNNAKGSIGLATSSIAPINDLHIGSNNFLESVKITNLGLVAVNRGIYGDRFSTIQLTSNDFSAVMGGPTLVNHGGTNASPEVWNLRDAFTDGIGTYIAYPYEWGTEASLKLEIKIAQAVADSGDILVGINTLFIGDSGAVTGIGLDHNKVFTLSGGADEVATLTFSNSETANVLYSAGSVRAIRLRIARVGGDAADTATTDIRILSVTLKREEL